MTKPLTKSRYCDGVSCIKLLWFQFNAPESIPPASADAKARMEQGIEVGNIAKKLFPKGIEIPRDNATTKTKELLKKRVPLFEASFSYGQLYCKVDLLIPVDKDEWDIIEVKSTTKVKDEHLDDAAFQTFVLKNAGIKIRKTHMMFINNEYVKKGKIDLKKLFSKEDITNDVLEKLTEVEENVPRFLKIIDGPMPEVEYGVDCQAPNDCPVCSQDVADFEINNLYYFGKKAWPLVNQGITKLKDLPKSVVLNERQKIQVQSTLKNKPFLDIASLKKFLKSLKFPIYCLDFETFGTAIPMYDGTRPYQNVPFQFSIHIMKDWKSQQHIEFLSDGKGDPRKELLKALKAIGNKGTILAYNASFEIKVLEALAEAFPKESKWIHDLIDRTDDLLIPFREFWYYHPLQNGSCSIKEVLPALTGKTYEGMEINQGGGATHAFLNILQGKVSKSEETKLRKALLEYCGQDTEGMVDILRVLNKLV